MQRDRVIAITRVTHTLSRCLLLLNRAEDTHDLVTTSDTSTKERSPLQWAMRSIHSATNGRASATREMRAVFITANSTNKRRRSRRYQLVDHDDVYVALDRRRTDTESEWHVTYSGLDVVAVHKFTTNDRHCLNVGE